MNYRYYSKAQLVKIVELSTDQSARDRVKSYETKYDEFKMTRKSIAEVLAEAHAVLPLADFARLVEVIEVRRFEHAIR